MRETTLNLYLPELSDEALAGIEEFLCVVLDAFQDRYAHQLKRHWQSQRESDCHQ